MQSDEQYIESILTKGSEWAVTALVKKHEVRVFNLCFRMLKSRELAEEVAQDTFLKGFLELRHLEDKSRYGAWIMRIAYRKAIDEVRKKRYTLEAIDGEHLVPLADDFFNLPDEELARNDREKLIENMLSKLPELDSALISLYYLEDMSVREVADVTCVSESNVKIRLMRARKLLKERLEKYFKEESRDLY